MHVSYSLPRLLLPCQEVISRALGKSITLRRTNRRLLQVAELLRFIWKANLDSFSRHTLKERERVPCSTKVNGFVPSRRVVLGEGLKISSEALFPTALFRVLCPTPLETVEDYNWPLRYLINSRESKRHGYPPPPLDLVRPLSLKSGGC